MAPKRFVFLVVACLAGANPACGQSRPRIAVIPLNPISVSKSDAEVVSGLLETALVKTECYEVIEQREASSVLEAQERTISDCTDESCAIEFGKLLAAEQIVLGTFSAIGGKYVLNAKIIDVKLGKNIKADTVEVATLDQVTQAAELLAFKLAGLTYVSGQEIQIAQTFGELFVETDPAGAEILINGVRKGTSPELIARVPLGKIRVEARKDNLYAMEEAEVTAKTGMLKLRLERQFGNLFVKSSETAVEVYLDGRKLGSLGSGFFKDIEAGDHALSLQGEGLWWEGAVTIRTGESTRVEAYPSEYGTLGYALPEDATGEVSGTNVHEVIRGAGTIRLWTGNYTVRVTASGSDPLTQPLEIHKAQIATLRPALALTREREEQAFTERLDKAQAAYDAAEQVGEATIAEAERLVADIRASPHGLQELLSRAEDLRDKILTRREEEKKAAKTAEDEHARGQRIADLTQKRDLLQAKLVWAQSARKKRAVAGGVLLGLTVATGAGAVVARLLANQAYAAYLEAATTPEARTLHLQTLVGDISFGVCLGGGGLCGVMSLGLWAGRPNPRAIADDLQATEAELAALQGGTQ